MCFSFFGFLERIFHTRKNLINLEISGLDSFRIVFSRENFAFNTFLCRISLCSLYFYLNKEKKEKRERECESTSFETEIKCEYR